MKKTGFIGICVSLALLSFGTLAGKTASAGEAIDYSQSRAPAQVYTPTSEEGRETIGNPGNGYLSGNRAWQGIPDAAVLSDGTMYCVIMTGGVYEDKDNCLVIERSVDGGYSWSEPVAVVDHEYEYCRVFDPMLFVDANGYLWCFYTQECTSYPAFEGKDSAFGQWAVYTENPEAEIPAWSTPFRITDNNVYTNSKPIINSEGEMLLTAWTWTKTGVFSQPEDRGVFVYKFKEYNEKWEKVSVVDAKEPTGFWETSIAEAGAGEYLILHRTVDGVYCYRTLDDMQTWTPSAPLTDAATGRQLSKTSSKMVVHRTPSGNLVLAYHDTENDARINLSVALSEDGGASWPYKMMIQPAGEVSYPMLSLTGDGYIYMVYDKDRHSNMRVMYSLFTEEDIRAGRIVSEKGKLNALIDNNGLSGLSVSVKPYALFAGQPVAAAKKFLGVKEGIHLLDEGYYRLERADGGDTLAEGENVLTVKYANYTQNVTLNVSPEQTIRYTLDVDQTEPLKKGESLDGIRKYISLKAYRGDGSVERIENYSLSGTIGERENEITLTYGDRTFSFTVYAESGAGCNGSVGAGAGFACLCAAGGVFFADKRRRRG